MCSLSGFSPQIFIASIKIPFEYAVMSIFDSTYFLIKLQYAILTKCPTDYLNSGRNSKEEM
jgi:hypothetical protein